ncbi:MAG TPA: hypothetical protein VG104_12880 [Candidatus Dormibacteraeota bacterium]|nr:hypothetical protein [Candidatus Dormibacteraeota bacterium]
MSPRNTIDAASHAAVTGVRPRTRRIPGTDDHVIPEAAQRAMAATAHSRISTFHAGHLGLISKPDAVVDVVLRAIHATE